MEKNRQQLVEVEVVVMELENKGSDAIASGSEVVESLKTSNIDIEQHIG